VVVLDEIIMVLAVVLEVYLLEQPHYQEERYILQL
jgi:hypothetical protein